MEQLFPIIQNGVVKKNVTPPRKPFIEANSLEGLNEYMHHYDADFCYLINLFNLGKGKIKLHLVQVIVSMFMSEKSLGQKRSILTSNEFILQSGT